MKDFSLLPYSYTSTFKELLKSEEQKSYQKSDFQSTPCKVQCSSITTPGFRQQKSKSTLKAPHKRPLSISPQPYSLFQRAKSEEGEILLLLLVIRPLGPYINYVVTEDLKVIKCHTGYPE